MKKFVLLMILGSFLSITQFVFADALILSSGKVVEGKIVHQTNVFVRIEPKDKAIETEEYLLENIEEIIKGKYVPAQVPVVEKVLPEAVVLPVAIPVEVQTVEPVVEADVENVEVESLPEIKKSAPEVLTMETIKQIQTQPATESGGTFQVMEADTVQEAMGNLQQQMLDEEKRQGGQFSPQNMSQESLAALTTQMEKNVQLSMKEQAPKMIGQLLKKIFIFIFVVGLIAFLINRAIDEDVKSEGPKAGFWRRAIAASIDVLIGFLVSNTVIALPGLFMPLDSPEAVPYYILTVVVFGAYVLYMGFGCAMFGNTYGKYVMNLRVVDYASGEKIRKGQAFVRMLSLIFWPVELMILILSKSKRRLGDAWANTKVLVVENKKSWLNRALFGMVIIVSGFMIIIIAGPVVANRMEIAKRARVYLDANQIDVVGNPQDVQLVPSMDRTRGMVTFKLKDADGKSIVVILVSHNNRWTVERAKYIKRKYFGLMTVNY